MARPRGVVAVLLLVALAGCAGGPATSPTATTTPSPTAAPATAAATTTATPSPTPRSTPTRTRTATAPSTAAPTATPTAAPAPRTARAGVNVTVTRVVDGDTIAIAYRNGTADTVRLLGIDTPEVHTETDPAEFEGVPDTQAGRECLRTEGQNASAHVTELLAGETVTLRFDAQAARRGYYGRLLAYVVLDGRNVNYRLVADGYARMYDSAFTQRDRFDDAEDTAQAADRGVWRCQSVATATPTPADGAADASALAVAVVHADAAGNDHENENDEYVVFENTGDEPLAIGGWVVSDEAGHAFVVPRGVTVGAGDRITLYTGSGTNTETELYWGSDSAIWNNDGDTVYVETAAGDTVIAYTYE